MKKVKIQDVLWEMDTQGQEAWLDTSPMEEALSLPTEQQAFEHLNACVQSAAENLFGPCKVVGRVEDMETYSVAGLDGEHGIPITVKQNYTDKEPA